MNLQSIETRAAALLGEAAAVATAVVAQLPTFINAADAAAAFVDDAASKLKGSDKLALVKAMAEAAFHEALAALDATGELAAKLGDLGSKFAAVWAVIGPFVTVLVQLRKFGLVKF